MFDKMVRCITRTGKAHRWLKPLALIALVLLFCGASLTKWAVSQLARIRKTGGQLRELRRDDMEQRERGKERAGAAKPVRSFYRPAHRAAAMALSVCMVFTLMPSMAFAAEAETGLCEHHPEHTAECGYEPASPCEHTHDGDCHTDELICGFDEETEQTASGSDAGHTHTPDCYALDCGHVHDETCGYSKGAPCTYTCELCNPSEAPSCLCDPQVTGEDGVHTNPDCPFYENQAPVCLCDPQVTEPDGVHTSPDCPFYAEPDEIDALCAAIDALPTVEELYENVPGNQDSEFDAWVAETRALLAEVPALQTRLSALTGDAAAMERVTQDRADKLAALNDFAQLLGERETKEANGTAPGGSVSNASDLQTALGGPDNASVDGDTVTILKNIEIPRTSSQIKITGGNLTLDLNGHKLSALANINIVYVNGAQGFTIKDSSENQTGDLSGERVHIRNTPFIVDGGNYGELNYINDNGQNYSISIKKGIFNKIIFPTGISISTALKDASVFTTAGEIISAKQLEKNLLFLTNGEKIKVVPTTNISSVYLSGSGSDTGLGTAESPFRSFERAKSAVADNGTIYIQSTYFVSSASETWSLSDKPNVTVMRASGNTSKMISVSNNATLTLNSIVIDGGSSNAGTENGPIIEASYGKLVINTGTILQNNRGPAILMLYSSNATMNGGTIQNNTLLTSNGAVSVGGTSNIDFKGGTIQNNMNGEVDCSIAVSASQVTAKISPNLTVSGMISLDSSKLIFTGVPTTNYKLALGSTYIKTEGAVVVELASGVSGTLDLSKFTLDSEDFVLQMGTGETEGKIVLGKKISSLERLQQSIDNANGTDNNPTVISIPQSGIEVDTTLIIPVDKYIKLTGGALTRAETFNSKPLFDVKGQLTLTGITLDGNKDNANGDGLLEVDGGSLILDTGAILQNNKNSSGNGGAVRVCAGGSVIMNAGKISGNEATAGGGVYVFNYFDETGGTFTMNGGEISGNTAEAGSGVYITKTSTFNLHSGAVIKGNAAPETVSSSGWDGTIEIEIRPSVNTFSFCDMPVPLAASYGITIPSSPDSWGGGVYNMGIFTMDGGEISDNTAGRGGAVYHADGTCSIMGGTISGNHNTYSGTGLYAREDFFIGGSANIADGIYLVTGKKALVTSALSNSIQIEGMEGAPVTGTVVAAGSSYTISDTDFGKFSIKDNAWTLEKSTGGQICLKAPTSQQSDAKEITAFSITNQVGNSVINQQDHIITVTMPADTDVTSLTPTITVSDKASVSPTSSTAQNFTNPVTYTVTAENGTTQTYTVTVTVQAPSGTAPTITTTTLPDGTVGTQYSQTLTATGTTPITWSVSAGSLPNGLTLFGNTISGTPTTTGTFPFTVKASNGIQPDATKQLSITIDAPEATVTGVTVSPGTATVQKGTTQQFSATVTGTNSPAQTVTWSVTGGKTGTSITSGLLTVASDETAATLTVTATSSVDTAKSGTATVTVTGTPVTRYTLTVTNGTGGGSFEAGANVAITANAPANGKVFDQWTSADGVSFADANSAATTITMPASDTAVTANYKDISVDTSAIDTAISAANEAKTGITTSDSPASSVSKGTKFVTAAQMQALNDAISAAQAAKGTVATAAEAQAAARALDAAIATFKAAIKTGTYTSSSSGDSGSSGGSGGGNGNNNGGATTPPADTGTTTDTTQAEVKADGKVDASSNAAATIPEKAVEDAIKKAEDEAKKNGTSDNGITLVLQVNTGGKTANSVTVNLPKATQEMIIDKKIVNTVIVVDNPNIRVGMDLSAIREINRQANADVNITAARMDNGKLTGDAKAAIGSRPVFDLSASYGTNRVQNFGAGTVCITIPYTLQKGEAAGGLYAVYVDLDGNVSYITNSSYDAQAGMLRFATNHFSVYGIGYKAPANFTDIANHWAKTDIEFAVNRGLMNGSSNTTFSPDGSMTRGMFVTALGRLAGVNTDSYKTGRFTDVKADAYYAPYVNWAAEKGIVSGTTTTTFAPDYAISRQEMAVIMSNYAKALGYKVPKIRTAVTFADHGSIGSWAADAVKQMQMAGILNGKDGNRFDPTGTATRAEVAAMLHRYVELVIDPATAQGLDVNDSGSAMLWENGKLVKSASRTVGTSAYSFNSFGEAALPVSDKKYRTHIVKKNEYFWAISRLYGCTMQKLMDLNGLKMGDVIHPGDVLKIPQV